MAARARRRGARWRIGGAASTATPFPDRFEEHTTDASSFASLTPWQRSRPAPSVYRFCAIARSVLSLKMTFAEKLLRPEKDGSHPAQALEQPFLRRPVVAEVLQFPDAAKRNDTTREFVLAVSLRS